MIQPGSRYEDAERIHGGKHYYDKYWGHPLLENRGRHHCGSCYTSRHDVPHHHTAPASTATCRSTSSRRRGAFPSWPSSSWTTRRRWWEVAEANPQIWYPLDSRRATTSGSRRMSSHRPRPSQPSQVHPGPGTDLPALAQRRGVRHHVTEATSSLLRRRSPRAGHAQLHLGHADHTDGMLDSAISLLLRAGPPHRVVLRLRRRYDEAQTRAGNTDLHPHSSSGRPR